MLTFTSIPLPSKLLLIVYLLLETQQKTIVERNFHVYVKDPKAKFWFIVFNCSFNARFTSRNTVHNHKSKHRFMQAY